MTEQNSTRQLSRRAFLQGTLASSATLALSPFFPNFALANVRGQLSAIAGTPNPAGAFEQLYWLGGSGISDKITSISSETALPQRGLKTGETRKLKLFHFNDLHNHITLKHRKKGDTHRFAQMFKIISEAKDIKRDDESILVFSAGDDHTGSVLDELSGWSKDEFVMDSAYRTYSAAGVDASAMGNHELDRGAEQLKLGIRQDARFPVLSANVHSSKFMDQGSDYYTAAIGTIDGMRIGMVGLTTPVDTHTHTKADPDLDVASPITCINNILPTLSENVDFVVVLSHCGYGEGSDRSGKAGAERYIGEGDHAIARAAAKVSKAPVIIIGGHTHTVLNANGLEERNLVDGVMIVQAGGHGSHLGEVDIEVEATVKGLRILDQQAKLHSIKKRDNRVGRDNKKFYNLEHDQDYDARFEQKYVAPLFASLSGKMAQKIADIKNGANLVSDKVYAERYIGESAIANFMNDALVSRSKTFPGGEIDVALFNATGLSSGIAEEGPLTFEDWYNVMPYADSIQIFEMTGNEIKQMLDSNAKRLVRPEELSGTSPVNVNGYVSRGFLHFSSSLRYQVKLNGSATMAEAINIKLNGMPLESQMDKKFRIAINSYIGAGGYSEAWNGKDIGAGVAPGIKGFNIKSMPRHDTGLIYRNEIIAHIKAEKVISPENGAKTDGRLTVIK